MTTSAYSNYGSTFTKGGSSIGACIVIDFPEITMGKVESTNHAGGGVREYIPDGLLGLGDITLSVIVASGVLSSIETELVAKTVSSCVITDSINTITFSGFYTSVKPEAADAQTPDVSKLTVVLSATGSIAIS